MTKTCYVCGEEKDDSLFRSVNTGARRAYKTKCRACVNKQASERYKNNPEIRKAIADKYESGHKDDKKARNAAYKKNNSEKISEKNKVYAAINSEKIKEYQRCFYNKNRENILKSKKEYYSKHPDKLLKKRKKYAKTHAKEISMRAKEYQLNNPEILRASVHRRRAAKAMATPLWYGELDKLVEVEAASLAILREKMFGFKWHVDHILPLRGKTVSGLHVHNNLAVIPAAINFSKSNKYPDWSPL